MSTMSGLGDVAVEVRVPDNGTYVQMNKMVADSEHVRYIAGPKPSPEFEATIAGDMAGFLEELSGYKRPCECGSNCVTCERYKFRERLEEALMELGE